MHYLELMKKPYNNTYINKGKRHHSLYRNIKKFLKRVSNWMKKELYIKDKNILNKNF